MSCLAGSQLSTYMHLNYLQTTHEHGRSPFSFSLFLNSSVEILSLIFLGGLYQRRLPRNKSEFIPWRVECAEGRYNVFITDGETFILK